MKQLKGINDKDSLTEIIIMIVGMSYMFCLNLHFTIQAQLKTKRKGKRGK